jgi:hypothetical protein
VTDAQPIGSIFKQMVERAIVGCDDPVARKERILIARETGIFTDAEAADWIQLFDLRAA